MIQVLLAIMINLTILIFTSLTLMIYRVVNIVFHHAQMQANLLFVLKKIFKNVLHLDEVNIVHKA
jgi:hypothetical protein